MCGLCGILGAAEHWTDSPDAKPRAAAERRRERARQVALANRVLAHYGLRLADWQGTAFVLSNRTGASEVVDHVAALWPAAGAMAKRPCDPLDPALLARIAPP